MDEACAPPLIQRDFDQIHAPRGTAREGVGRAPEARERVGSEAHARAKALARAAGLDLDHDQSFALREHEVELGPARFQAPCQEAPAAGPKSALDQAFPRACEEGIAGRERA